MLQIRPGSSHQQEPGIVHHIARSFRRLQGQTVWYSKEDSSMLILTRRVCEEIVIGDIVRLRIVAVQSQRVKVGIIAPSHVTVHREEVYRRLQGLRDCTENAEQNQNAVSD
jgi:carbon storage regulator